MVTAEQAIEIYKQFASEVLIGEQWYQNISSHIAATLLYGSVAKGTNRVDSDIDFLIILPLAIEERYTTGEYFYDFNGQQINIVLRSIERLRDIAAKHSDTFQQEVFRGAVIIESTNEVKELLDQINSIKNYNLGVH